MLEIKVPEIRGRCPVYKVGDKIVIDDPSILLDRTDALCTHALSTLRYYIGARLVPGEIHQNNRLHQRLQGNKKRDVAEA